MVENEQVTGSLASREMLLRRYAGEVPPTPSEYEREDNTFLSSTSSSAMAMAKPPVGGGGYHSSGTASTSASRAIHGTGGGGGGGGSHSQQNNAGGNGNNINNNNSLPVGINNAETARMYAEFLHMQTLASPTKNKVEEMNGEGVVTDGMLMGSDEGGGGLRL